MGWTSTIGFLVGWSNWVLLLAVPVVMSWLFGGVNGYVQLAAFGWLIGTAGFWALATMYQRALPRVTIATWICGGAACLAGLQCATLPQAVIDFVSPKAVELRSSLLDKPSASTSITQDLASTRHATALLIMARQSLGTRWWRLGTIENQRVPSFCQLIC
jgi:hypothetical protein